MRNKPENSLEFYLNFALRKYVWNVGSRFQDYYFVAEYPKSGGTWFSQMLADYLEIPFARNISRPYLSKSVVHGHEAPKPHVSNSFLVVRDGRDVMVSFYYHHFFKNEWNYHPAVEKRKSRSPFTDFDNIQENMAVFIEYIATEWASGINHIHWGDFNDEWIGSLSMDRVIRYEDLQSDCFTTMSKVLSTIDGVQLNEHRLMEVVKKNSFKKVAGRSPGQENNKSFARKGIVGDWRNVFTEESSAAFDKYFGDHLVKFGYEKDDAWAKCFE